MKNVLIVFLQLDLLLELLLERSSPLLFRVGGARTLAVLSYRRNSPQQRLRTAPNRRQKKGKEREPKKALIPDVVLVSFIIFVPAAVIMVICTNKTICSSVFYSGRSSYQQLRSFSRHSQLSDLDILKLNINRTFISLSSLADIDFYSNFNLNFEF